MAQFYGWMCFPFYSGKYSFPINFETVLNNNFTKSFILSLISQSCTIRFCLLNVVFGLAAKNKRNDNYQTGFNTEKKEFVTTLQFGEYFQFIHIECFPFVSVFWLIVCIYFNLLSHWIGWNARFQRIGRIKRIDESISKKKKHKKRI